MNGFQRQLATHETPVTKVEVELGAYPGRVSWGRCELCQVRSGRDTNRVSITDAIDTLDFSACDACADAAEEWTPSPEPTVVEAPDDGILLEDGSVMRIVAPFVTYAAPAVSASERAVSRQSELALLDAELDAFAELANRYLTPELESRLYRIRGRVVGMMGGV